MANVNPIYNLPSDDLSPSATITAPTGTPDSTYGVVGNLWNGQPGLPFKFDTTFGSFVYQFASPVIPYFPILRHTNLDPSTGSAYIQGGTSSAFSSGDPQTFFTLNSADPDGFRDDTPLNLTGVAGVVARDWWRIVFANNPENLIVGGVWFGAAIRQFTHAPSRGLVRDQTGAHLVSETAEGVLATYDLGTRWDTLDMTVVTSRSVGLPALKTLHQSARRRVMQWPLWLDLSVNRALFVRFDQDDLPVKGLAVNAVSIAMKLREVSKGQAWS
jgi:hypothetical protein